MREVITKTIVYSFGELSEEAKQKAIDNLADINADFEWWEFVYEDASNIGVKIEEFDLDRGQYCRGQFMRSEFDVAEAILKDHGKDCETYKDAYEFVWATAIAENKFYDENRKEAIRNGCEYTQSNYYDDFDPDYECPDELEEFRRTIFEDYRRMLQTEYDYLTTEEAIIDTIEANEYEFTADGEIF